MEVQINVPKGFDTESVAEFLTKLKFKNLSFRQSNDATNSAGEPKSTFCIDVIDGQEDLKVKELENFLNGSTCSLLVFNPEAKELDEPKVIFATDHSSRANQNLERFRQLKPAGFSGATVISEDASGHSAFAIHECTQKFLERTKKAVQSTQANLIIANFDLTNILRNTSQATNLVKLVLQNQCHVLILKS